GGPVRLASVAEIRQVRGPASIQRFQQQRVARITATPSGVDLGTALERVRSVLAATPTPGNVTRDLAGQSEEMTRSYENLAFILLLAVFLVYVVLASNFESLSQPFLILFAVPLAFVGVVPALLLTGHSLSILVLLGGVMLAGIVVNNAIVLVDAINRRRRQEGQALREAIVEGGKERLRPILITTATTVLGLTPMAVGLGAGDELRAPLAITVIGGLLLSTVLTLVVIPCVYRIVAREDLEEAVPAGPGRPRAPELATEEDRAGPPLPAAMEGEG
ncbi:MAG: efflux RND transporter permease subunit, partial [Thermoanaerobaculia bacterium]|nr:efflux RND transporter permease subunit [Thermoanaerobaculia bacterium]